MRRRESDEEGRGEDDSPWSFCARRCSRSPSVSGRLASLVEEMPQGQAQAWQHIAVVQLVARRQHLDLGCRCVRIDLHLDGINHPHQPHPGLVILFQLLRDLVGRVRQADDLDSQIGHDGPGSRARDAPVPPPTFERDEGDVRPPLPVDLRSEVEDHLLDNGGGQGSDRVCAVKRCWSSVGAIPTRQLGDVANNIANQPLIFETAIPRARLRGSTR